MRTVQSTGLCGRLPHDGGFAGSGEAAAAIMCTQWERPREPVAARVTICTHNLDSAPLECAASVKGSIVANNKAYCSCMLNGRVPRKKKDITMFEIYMYLSSALVQNEVQIYAFFFHGP